MRLISFMFDADDIYIAVLVYLITSVAVSPQTSKVIIFYYFTSVPPSLPLHRCHRKTFLNIIVDYCIIIIIIDYRKLFIIIFN